MSVFEIAVDNLPVDHTNEANVSNYFIRCGSIKKIKLIPPKNSQHKKIRAYIQFFDYSACIYALQLNNTLFCGNIIHIKLINQKQTKPTPFPKPNPQSSPIYFHSQPQPQPHPILNKNSFCQSKKSQFQPQSHLQPQPQPQPQPHPIFAPVYYVSQPHSQPHPFSKPHSQPHPFLQPHSQPHPFSQPQSHLLPHPLSQPQPQPQPYPQIMYAHSNQMMTNSNKLYQKQIGNLQSSDVRIKEQLEPQIKSSNISEIILSYIGIEPDKTEFSHQQNEKNFDEIIVKLLLTLINFRLKQLNEAIEQLKRKLELNTNRITALNESIINYKTLKIPNEHMIKLRDDYTNQKENLKQQIEKNLKLKNDLNDLKIKNTSGELSDKYNNCIDLNNDSDKYLSPRIKKILAELKLSNPNKSKDINHLIFELMNCKQTINLLVSQKKDHFIKAIKDIDTYDFNFTLKYCQIYTKSLLENLHEDNNKLKEEIVENINYIEDLFGEPKYGYYYLGNYERCNLDDIIPEYLK